MKLRPRVGQPKLPNVIVSATPLPCAEKSLRDQEDTELTVGNPWTTLKEWYGDLSQLFHCLFIFRFSISARELLKAES
jgi:hypothetical protein